MILSTQKPGNILKTLIDYLVTSISLIILSPIIVFLALLVKMSGKGPVIYSQKRIGRSGKPFYIYKFRSMHYQTENGTTLISGRGDKRITKLGQLMRKHRLDEIPNFINVLKGEMSLIGPRPEQQFYIDQIVQIDPRYLQLQFLKPGISSWGQVKFGYATNVAEMVKRFEYDLFYLENRSLWFDFKIGIHTLAIIIKGHGI